LNRKTNLKIVNLAGAGEKKNLGEIEMWTDKIAWRSAEKIKWKHSFVALALLIGLTNPPPRRPCGANPVWQPPNKSSSSQPKGWAGGGERGPWAG
jgi:hypothetical protein